MTASIPFEGTIVSHAFSPDNRRLLISSKMGAFENVNATRSVQIWDLQTGNPITTLMRHHDQPTSGYLSPDGGQLVTVAGSEVRLWDAVNGKPLSPLLPHNLPVDSVEFTSDNERILTRDRSGTIRIWDVLSSIPAAVRFHPDGWIRDTILNREGTVALIKTWADCERKPGTAFGIAQATGAEADVEVYCKWSIRLWDTRTGQPISELIGSGREGSEPAGAFNQEGDRAVIWNNKQVHFWDVARRQRIGNVIVVEHPVVGARVCPDGRSILILFEESDSAKKTTTRARLWDGPKGEPLSEPFGLPSGSFFSPRFCCQGKRILLADIYQNGKNGEALLVDDSGKSVAGPFSLKSFVFDHDLQKSMELDEKNQISVRNLTTGAIIDKPISFDMPVLSYWFDQHRDALCVLSGTNQPGSTWKLWNSRSGVVEIQSADHSNRPLGYLQSSTGQLFLDSQNRTIRVRQSSDGQLRGLLMEHPKPVTQAAVFGPNNLLLSVCGDFNFRGEMYVKTRTQTSLPSDRQQLGGSFFSPLLTREYSFTGINDHRWDVGQLRVWDGNTGELIVPPLHRVTEGLGDWRYCSEMSEDGSRLLRCLDPNTVETWELPRDRKSGGQWMEVAEVLSGRKFDQSGSLTNLPSGAWQKLCESHPEVTALPERNWIDWHQSQADRSADQYDWRAAKLHLDRLSEIAPFDRKRSLHRARCYYQLDLPVLGNQAFLEAAAIPPQHLAQRNSVVLYQDAYGSRLAGYWLKKSGKLKESTAAYHEAIAAIEELLGRSPLALDYRNDLVTFTKEFGEHLLELKSYSEADELYQKITARLEKLTRDFPEEETCKFDLAQCYRACGVTNEKAGRMKIAIEFADKGLATLQPFLKRTPLSEKYKSLACNTHWGRAVALDSLERYSEAADAWNETLKFSAPPQANNLSWLCAISRVRSGDHARATQDVESLISGSPLTANDFFNAACVFAVASSKAGDDGKLKARYASRALELLNKAKDKGQFQEKAQVDELKTDTDLEAIRSLDEYKKLLKEVEK